MIISKNFRSFVCLFFSVCLIINCLFVYLFQDLGDAGFQLTVGGNHLQEYIDHVVFKMHDSFATPQIIVHDPPFFVRMGAWGHFDAVIVFHFKKKYKRTPVSLIWWLGFYRKFFI